jgi:hypothetical protein
MTKYNGKELQALLDTQYVKHFSLFDKACIIATFTLTAYMAVR